MGSATVANPATPVAAGGFQFITSINTIKRDDETRRKVRSHARRQRLPNEPEHVLAAKKSTQKERTSKFRINTSSARTSASAKRHPQPSPKTSSPTSSTHGSTGDESRYERGDALETEMITNELAMTIVRELPRFAVLPIQTTPLTENLFKYIMCVCLSPQEKFVQKWFDRCGAPTYFNTYHSSFLALSHSMNPQGNWFDFITVDPAMTHGFMGLVAAMHNALAGWDDMTTIDFHRYEAVKHINKRLNMEGRNDTTVSDGVMVSVSMLVQIESFIGSLDSAKAHLNGLKRMVDLRGGLIEGLGYSTLLQRALAWADFAYASAAMAPLSFPLIAKIANPLPLQDRFIPRSMMMNENPTSDSNDVTIHNRAVMELLELLYSTTDAVNTFEFAKLEDLRGQRSQMSDSIYWLEYQLCKLEEETRSRGPNRTWAASVPLLTPPPFMGDEAEKSSDATDISDALVYAIHLFLHLALRGQPPAAKRNKGLIEVLMSSLCDTLLRLDLLLDTPSVASTSPGTTDSIDVPHSEGSSVESWSPPSEFHADPFFIPSQSPKVAEARKDHLHDDILLWVLFMGACVQVPTTTTTQKTTVTVDNHVDDLEVSHEGDYRALFLTALRKFCQVRLIVDKEVLVTKLRSVIWLDSWCERQLDMVWTLIGDEMRV